MTKVMMTSMLAFCAFLLQAQTTIQTVDKQFELGAYDLAIPGYLEILHKDPSSTHAMLHLAKAYRMIHEDFESVKWYSKAHQSGDLSEENMLEYGHALKRIGRYDKAKEIYAQVDGELSYKGSHYRLSCDEAQLLSTRKIGETVALALNSKSQDFAPEVNGGKLYFSSFRKDIPWKDQVAKKLANLAESSHHFVIPLSDIMDNVSPTTPGVSKAFPQHSAPYSIAQEAQKVVFAKNHYKEGVAQIKSEESGIGLYIADVSADGSWRNIKPFAHNSGVYSNNYPYITEDGQSIYFASNRPGGYGEYDLYVSHNENGIWSQPENLGPKINTEGSEVTPLLDGKTLYFSSDWHFGLGGMDVFKSVIESEEWMEPMNMGAGFNSSSDDYSPVLIADDKFVYVSNRLGGYGMEDLYFYSAVKGDLEIKKIASQETNARTNRDKVKTKPVMEQSSTPVKVLGRQVTLLVQDHTGKRISEAVVDLSACGLSSARTDETGKLTMTTNQDCKISVKAPGYLRAIVKIADGYVNSDGMKTVVLMRDTESAVSTTSYTKTKPATESRPSVKPERAKRTEVSSTSSAAPQTSYWTVQIAAFSEYKDRLSRYQKLSSIGEVHGIRQGNMLKVSVGKFKNKAEASAAMQTLKAKGYADAFLKSVEGYASHASSATQSSPKEESAKSTFEGQSQYKIRLAAYTDTKWFDVDKVEDLGKVEQWTSREFTVMVLSGFSGMAQAKEALEKAKQRGFKDAQLVKDENGILTYISGK